MGPGTQRKPPGWSVAALALLITAGVGGWYVMADDAPSPSAVNGDPSAATAQRWRQLDVPFDVVGLASDDHTIFALAGDPVMVDQFGMDGGGARAHGIFASTDDGETWTEIDAPDSQTVIIAAFDGMAFAGIHQPRGVRLDRFEVQRWQADGTMAPIPLPTAPLGEGLDLAPGVLVIDDTWVLVAANDEAVVAMVVQSFRTELAALVPEEYRNDDYAIIPTPNGLNVFDASAGQDCVFTLLMAAMSEEDRTQDVRNAGCDPDTPTPELIISITPEDAGLGELPNGGALVDVYRSLDGQTFEAVALQPDLAASGSFQPYLSASDSGFQARLGSGIATSESGDKWILTEARADWLAGPIGSAWDNDQTLFLVEDQAATTVNVRDLIVAHANDEIQAWNSQPLDASVAPMQVWWMKENQQLTELYLAFFTDDGWTVESADRMVTAATGLLAATEHGDVHVLAITGGDGARPEVSLVTGSLNER